MVPRDLQGRRGVTRRSGAPSWSRSRGVGVGTLGEGPQRNLISQASTLTVTRTRSRRRHLRATATLNDHGPYICRWHRPRDEASEDPNRQPGWHPDALPPASRSVRARQEVSKVDPHDAQGSCARRESKAAFRSNPVLYCVPRRSPLGRFRESFGAPPGDVRRPFGCGKTRCRRAAAGLNRGGSGLPEQSQRGQQLARGVVDRARLRDRIGGLHLGDDVAAVARVLDL